jgi:DNA repair protein RecO (recombination protein O)
MKHLNTTGIVLTRVDYGEADRIITFLTPDQGKITGIAKGVRRQKSKLAGGIELFSISEISYIQGKREISTITSTRLKDHYGNIVKELNRTQTAFEIIKVINKATEDKPEEAYFNLTQSTFAALNDLAITPELTKTWFNMQLLKIAGHTPDLKTDTNGNKLDVSSSYDFHLEQMQFVLPVEREGMFDCNHIKFLRLCANAERPHLLSRVNNVAGLTDFTKDLVQSMLATYVRI